MEFYLFVQLQTIRAFLRSKSLRDQGISMHIVTPLEDLKLGNDPATNVVAFDAEAVYTLADAGKKPIVGNSELINQLRYDSDPCISGALRVSKTYAFNRSMLIKLFKSLRQISYNFGFNFS